MEQLNLDGFDLSELQALDTKFENAINQRLSPNGSSTPLAAESYTIKGRDVSLTPLAELLRMQANIKNAIAKKQAEPDGLGIGLATINDADGPPAGGGSYRWPFTR